MTPNSSLPGTGEPPLLSNDPATNMVVLKEELKNMMVGPRTWESESKYKNMESYTATHQYCDHSICLNHELLSRSTVSCFPEFELYNYLKELFAAYLEAPRELLESAADQDLLVFYASEWDWFNTGVATINYECSYLNLFWVHYRQNEGVQFLYRIDILALLLWRELVFYAVREKLLAIVLGAIEKARNGGNIDTGSVKKVINSFFALSLDEYNHGNIRMAIYEEEFQTPFIEATEKYYTHESANDFQQHAESLPDYLKKVEERLYQEADLAETLLHSHTRKVLIEKCEDILIRAHLEKIKENFQTLFDSDRDEAQKISDWFEEDVKNAGLQATEDLKRNADCSAGGSVDPKLYVDTIFAVYYKNKDILNRKFDCEAGFAASLDRACRHFVNLNAVTGTSYIISPELLVRYTDVLLRTNSASGEDGGVRQDSVDKVITLFKYVEDKDVFQTFYAIRLFKRLIAGVSVSNDSEVFVIAKLKEVCGSEYANKLERMFVDIVDRRELGDRRRAKQ
ncbi:Cullin-1 [Rhizoctonia solani]|uniref:Cullin-1 n=1 Tax=Rhizoctonia solani TaxID=456999 RepID=A0A0K6G427_9AGAM|nr:Cullin-1 [Rhizoctonia solani]